MHLDRNDNNDIKLNSVFESSWWLNVVAKNKWKEIIIDKGKNTLNFKYVISKRFGYSVVTKPPLTQQLGLNFHHVSDKIESELSTEKDLIFELINKFSKTQQFDIYLHTNNKYILPFLWKGFTARPYFSYQLKNIKDLQNVWKGFNSSVRSDIRKAEKKLVIKTNANIKILKYIHKKTFERQNKKNPYVDSIYEQLQILCSKDLGCKFFYAIDEMNNVYGSALYIYDKTCCYYLAGGADPQYRNSGVSSLLIWEGIKFASQVSDKFDFEGSMVENIERHFRKFGGEPVVYYRLTKLNLLLRVHDFAKYKVKNFLNIYAQKKFERRNI